MKINNQKVAVLKNENNDFRGVHIYLINPENGLVVVAKVFDTYKSPDYFDGLISQKIPEGYIVVAACKDDMITSLSY